MKLLTDEDIQILCDVSADMMAATVNARMFRTAAGVLCDLSDIVIGQEKEEREDDPVRQKNAARIWTALVAHLDRLFKEYGFDMKTVKWLRVFEVGHEMTLLNWMREELETRHKNRTEAEAEE